MEGVNFEILRHYFPPPQPHKLKICGLGGWVRVCLGYPSPLQSGGYVGKRCGRRVSDSSFKISVTHVKFGGPICHAVAAKCHAPFKNHLHRPQIILDHS
jgi:hypothetical protein